MWLRHDLAGRVQAKLGSAKVLPASMGLERFRSSTQGGRLQDEFCVSETAGRRGQGIVTKIVRHLLIILTALPIFIGLATASFAAPCSHSSGSDGTGSTGSGSEGNGAPDRSSCPCCDEMLPTVSATCGLACHAGIEAAAHKLRPLPDAYRLKFALLQQSEHGLDLQPPLPPPR